MNGFEGESVEADLALAARRRHLAEAQNIVADPARFDAGHAHADVVRIEVADFLDRGVRRNPQVEQFDVDRADDVAGGQSATGAAVFFVGREGVDLQTRIGERDAVDRDRRDSRKGGPDAFRRRLHELGSAFVGLHLVGRGLFFLTRTHRRQNLGRVDRHENVRLVHDDRLGKEVLLQNQPQRAEASQLQRFDRDVDAQCGRLSTLLEFLQPGRIGDHTDAVDRGVAGHQADVRVLDRNAVDAAGRGPDGIVEEPTEAVR